MFNGSDWGCLIRGRNESEWQVNLMVVGIALGFWEVLFYDLEKVGNIDGEQHRAKAWSMWYSSSQLFLFWKSSFSLYLLSSLRKIWREPFQNCSTNTKTGTKVSNKILWSIVSNAALRSSMTRRVTFGSSMFSKISDFTFMVNASQITVTELFVQKFGQAIIKETLKSPITTPLWENPLVVIFPSQRPLMRKAF